MGGLVGAAFGRSPIYYPYYTSNWNRPYYQSGPYPPMMAQPAMTYSQLSTMSSMPMGQTMSMSPSFYPTPTSFYPSTTQWFRPTSMFRYY